MIHRDIKPGNLLVSQTGEVKLADFGLVKAPDINSAITMTIDGEVMGTPYFMSPEQCQSEELDHRSDIYSLGATYYSLLTGKQPYASHGAPLQIMFAHCDSDTPDPRDDDPAIPAACVELLNRAMEKSPQFRYQTAAEMHEAFAQLHLELTSGTGRNRHELPTAAARTTPATPSVPAIKAEDAATSYSKRYSHMPSICPRALRAASWATLGLAAAAATAIATATAWCL